MKFQTWKLAVTTGFAASMALALPLSAQATNWSRIVGTTASDSWGTAIATDGTGNCYVTGAYGDPSGFLVVTIKYSPSGAVLWQRISDSPLGHGAYGTAIAVNSGGDVYVAGSAIAAAGSDDFLTIKYNSAGTKQWARTYNASGNFYDDAVAVGVDNSGQVYVAGTVYETVGKYNFGIVAYDPNGAKQWFRSYTGTVTNGDDLLQRMVVKPSGGAVITGFTETEGTDNFDFMTICYDATGVKLWNRRFGDPSIGPDKPHGLALDADENVYVTGEFWSGTRTVAMTLKYTAATGVTIWKRQFSEAGQSDYPTDVKVFGDRVGVTMQEGATTHGPNGRIVMYDTSGTKLWTRLITGTENSSNDDLVACAFDGAGNFYATGYIQTPDSWDYETLKYDPNGVKLYGRQFDGAANGTDLANAIAVDAAGDCYVTGSSYNGTSGYTDIATVGYPH